MGRRTLTLAIAIPLLLGCSGGSDGTTAPELVAESLAATTTEVNALDAILNTTSSVSLESRLEQSFSHAAIRATGVSIDPKLFDLIGELETAVLDDARTKQEALVAVSDTTEVAPSSGPQFLVRTQISGGGFGAVGVLLEGFRPLGDRLQAGQSANGSATKANEAGTGTSTLGLELSSSAAGSSGAGLSMESDVTGTDGTKVQTRLALRAEGPRCPDTAGALVLTFSGEMSSTVTPPSGKATSAKSTFKGTINASFDDSAEVANVTIDTDVEASRTEASGRSTYVNFRKGNSATDPFTGGRMTSATGSITRSSQSVSVLNDGDAAMVGEAAEIVFNAALGVLAGRKVTIQNNGCVVIEASPKTKVSASEVVPFEVRTKHVVEGVPLDKRVDATLTGKGSLDPSSLAKTPDKLTYTAGAERDDSGTISLVSKSRRGIGSTAVTITVGGSFRVDQALGALGINGDVCSLDAPFTLNITGELPGTITFTPGDVRGGSFSGTGKVGSGTIKWSGSYTVTGADTDSPVIAITESATSLEGGPRSIKVPDFWEGGDTFTLNPGGECAAR